MNRDRAKELLPIIEAFANGEMIQYRDRRHVEGHLSAWVDIINEGFFIDNLKPATDDYRIKPKPREFWICWDEIDRSPCAYFDHETLDGGWDNFIKVREVLE